MRRNDGLRERVDVPNERVFIGLEAYQQVIQNSDLVLLATPHMMLIEPASENARACAYTHTGHCFDTHQ